MVLALPARSHSKTPVKLSSANTPAPSESVASSGSSTRRRRNGGRTAVLHTVTSALGNCQLINEKKQLWGAAQDVIGTGLQ